MHPGFILMLGLAWLYTRVRIDETVLGALFLGVQAAVLAVILRFDRLLDRQVPERRPDHRDCGRVNFSPPFVGRRR